MSLSRRALLKSLPPLVSLSGFLPAQCAEPRRKLPVAGITTTFTNASHADVIFSKITDGWQQDGGAGPDLKLVSLFVDQVGVGDLSRDVARKHDVSICRAIDEALTLGTNDLTVAGVLIVGEHGNYGRSAETQQVLYPRRAFFDAVVQTFRRVGRCVPVFNDKHLSHNWTDAQHMVETARAMQFPLLAGSSVPLSWRVPNVSLPRGCRIDEALAIGFGGLEAYGFHTLEGLQAMVEVRRGGETGVASVETLRGDAIWQAAKDGRWSRHLFEAALDAAPRLRKSEPERFLRTAESAWFLIEYRDGLRATIAMANGVTDKFAFAAKHDGKPQPVATHLALQDGFPTLHFANQLRAIEALIHDGRSPLPIERTLLTTGVLHAALLSLHQDKRIETPHLNIKYEPTDWPHTPGTPPPAVRLDKGSIPRR